MSIFKNCSVVLVLKDLPFKEKNRLKLAIIENGGIISHVVNKQCSLIVTNSLTSLSSSRLRCILKHHTPVVGLDYVTQCLKKGVRLPAEEYSLAPPPPPCHLLLASPSSVPVSHGPEIKIGVSNPVEEQFKVQKPTRKAVNQSKRAGNEDNETHAFEAVRVCTEEGNEFPTFPTSFQVAKYCIFIKDQSRTWSVLELQSGRGEGGQRYRVVHLWREHGAKSSAPQNKVVLVSTSERAVEVYQGLRKELQAKGLTLSSSLPDDAQGLVSTSLQQLLLEEKLNCGALTPEVCVFVELLWKEALGCLGNVLKVPVESLSLNDVSRAEGLLLQAQRILREAKNGELTSLMEDVYSLLPHRLACPPVDAKLISQKLDLCQLIRDILDVSEFTLRSPVPSCLGKYRALRCGIDIVPPGTPEFHVVSNLLHDRKVQILQVLRVSRGVELQMFKEELGYIKPLLHSSRPSSFVGILSRGLLLPRVGVEHHGIERTDIGNLGSGIYFSDSMSTSLKYSKPIETDGSRLLLVCDVALGSCRDLHKRDTRLSQAPEGYQSVHGVRRTPNVQSDFEDDEYVVYSPDQVKLKYVVQFSVEEDQLKEFSPAIEASLELPLPRSNFELGTHEEDVGICKNPLDDVTAGLLDSSGQPLPLQAVHVKCKLMDLLCQVIIFQTYTNQRSIPIEAKYVFPLDDSAAVCGFEAFINGKHVVGKVKEKEQARKDYKQAIEKGHGAYLMDQDAPNVFTISVGNLPPDATVLIKITFVTELVILDGTVLFSLPGSVAPWQQNAALNQTTQATVEKVCVTDVATQGEFTLDMSVEMPYEILDLSCMTHKVKVKQTACKAVVSVLPGETMGSDGFELSFTLAKSHLPRMWVENHPDKDSQACMLVFYPDFDVQPDLDFSSSEVILLLDTSESMIGEALQNARRVALQFLKIIDPSLRVNVISFGTDYNEALLSARPLLEALQPIKTFISTSPPVGGSTDLWRALRSLSLLPPSRGVRNLLLLSDGHIQNQSLTLQMVRDGSQHSRLFTCGLSPSANRHMLRALSQAGGGAYEFFDTKTKHTWAEKVASQVKRMASPGCSSVSVKWQQFNPRAPPPVQAPAQLNALFSNCHNLVYGFVPHCTQATLFGDLSGQEIQTMVSTSELQKTKGTFLHKLTARAVIRDYEDGSLAPDEAEHEGKKSELKSYIIELSKEFSILSQYTSFVAIEERDTQQLDVGFTDVAKLIAEEDVDFLPYLSWKEEEDVVVADLYDEDIYEVIECDSYKALEESSIVSDLTKQDEKQDLRKMSIRNQMRVRGIRSLLDPLEIGESLEMSQKVQMESCSQSAPFFGSFLSIEDLPSRPAAPPLPFFASPCPPPPSYPCPPPPPLVQQNQSLLDLMDSSAMFSIQGSVALESNEQVLTPRKMARRKQHTGSRRMAVPVSSSEVQAQSLSIESKELSHSLGSRISSDITNSGAQHYFEAASSITPQRSLLLDKHGSFEHTLESNQSFSFGVPAGAATAAFGGYSVPDGSVGYAAKKRCSKVIKSGPAIAGDFPMVPPTACLPPQLPQAVAPLSNRRFDESPLYDLLLSSSQVPRSSQGVMFGGPGGATHTGFGGRGGGGGGSIGEEGSVVSRSKRYAPQLGGLQQQEADLYIRTEFISCARPSVLPLRNQQGMQTHSSARFDESPLYDQLLSSSQVPRSSQGVMFGGPGSATHTGFEGRGGGGGGGRVVSRSKRYSPRLGGLQQQEAMPYLKTKFICCAPCPSALPLLNQQEMQTHSSTREHRRSLDFRKSSLDQVQIQWTQIFGMQHSEGYWECTESLGVLIGLDVHLFANVFLKNKGICSLGVRAHADILKLVATLLVLQLMRVKKLEEGKLLLSLFRFDDAPQQRSERWNAVKKAVDWVRWADRQYPCVCSRLEFGWDWESSTRQLLGVDPPKPFSPLSRMGSATEPKIFLGLVATS